MDFRPKSSLDFLYDLVNSVQELSGTVPMANPLIGGLDEYFVRTVSTGTSNFMTAALGSTAALTDSTGTIQTQYSFDLFGNTTQIEASRTNSFACTGCELDGTGLYVYRARYYNPSLQRFISQDPKGLRGELNEYAHTDDNPALIVDPAGTDRLPRDVNRCAASLANTISNLPSDSLWAQALAGSDVSTISNIITNQNRFWVSLSAGTYVGALFVCSGAF